MRIRRFAIIVVFIIAVALCISVFSYSILNKYEDFQFYNINSSTKTIYVPPEKEFSIEEATEGQRLFNGQHCPVSDCLITTNGRHAHDVNCYIFRSRIPEFIPVRKVDQIWVYQNLESPASSKQSRMRHKVNWTITYRRDSTIPIAYNKIIPKAAKTSLSKIILELSTKTKLVAWFVSNCVTINGRMEYAIELGRYVNVDIYGRCGTLQCTRNQSLKCLGMVRSDYKFYLSFENSNCLDYITEKFFNALDYDVIPIVMGASPEDYQKVAPPHSYIHVEDFESPQHLAHYLHKLDKNDTLYFEYFKWKETLTVGSYDSSYWCALCAMLHNSTSDATWYPDIMSWWAKDGVCSDSKTWKLFRNKPSQADWHRYIWYTVLFIIIVFIIAGYIRRKRSHSFCDGFLFGTK